MKYKPFQPRKYAGSKHVQTVFNMLFPPKNILRTEYFCEDILLEVSDGSNDCLWLEHNPPLSWWNAATSDSKYNGHYIVMVHGMEGDSESHYLVSLTSAALQRGYGTIRVNLRNCGRGEGYARSTYNAGTTQDIHDVLEYVQKKFTPNVFLSGFSLSGNMVLKYFGEDRKTIGKAFSASSPPLDLKKNCEFIDSPPGRLYRNYFLQSLKKKFNTAT